MAHPVRYDVIIIGGGAAGMAAGIFAARRGLSVCIIEQNTVFGKKLRITGKGRCNITNNCPVQDVIDNIPTGGKFLMSAVNAFPPSSVMAFFEELGVPLKTERGRRVFPVSDNANDPADALVRELNRLDAAIIRAKAEKINTAGGSVASVSAAGRDIPCGAVIIAAGGVSYPATGSTGTGYDMARSAGHTVVPPRPSLVPLVSPEVCCAEMQGLSLRNVHMKVFGGGAKPVYEDFGELLFTHYGISGPLALSASAHMRELDSREYRVSLDLKHALDDKQLDERLQRDLKTYANSAFKNSLRKLLPRLMIPVIVRRTGIDPDKKSHSITREERRKLLNILRSFDVRITGARPVEEAVITSGGVAVLELVPATMESKIVKNLHFAGEIIDADAYTGGYNLQIAWATAYCAGTRVLSE